MLPDETSPETPLEAAVRVSEQAQIPLNSRDEREADILVADIDDYVATTDPTNLLVAEDQLEAWEIPVDPLDEPSDLAENPVGNVVSVFGARTEAEANIIKGILHASGIPAALDNVAGPMGGIFTADDTAWADIVVPEGYASAARQAIQDATQNSA